MVRAPHTDMFGFKPPSTDLKSNRCRKQRTWCNFFLCNGQGILKPYEFWVSNYSGRRPKSLVLGHDKVKKPSRKIIASWMLAKYENLMSVLKQLLGHDWEREHFQDTLKIGKLLGIF